MGGPITIESWRRETGPRIMFLQKALLLMGNPEVSWEPIKDDDNLLMFSKPLPIDP